ncbi:MAG: hypothetical protein R3E39_09980 [Anaerolineae bacterium]
MPDVIDNDEILRGIFDNNDFLIKLALEIGNSLKINRWCSISLNVLFSTAVFLSIVGWLRFKMAASTLRLVHVQLADKVDSVITCSWLIFTEVKKGWLLVGAIVGYFEQHARSATTATS